jgi:anti-anti-sigma factor
MSDELQVLRPTGRLDSDTSPELERQAHELIGKGARRLLLDLRDLYYISSAGLRAVVIAARDMAAAGGRVAISSPNDQVTEVFDISGFVTVVDIHRSAESAAARLLEE